MGTPIQNTVTEEVVKAADAGFRPGSIHDNGVFSFWKDTIGASDWVLRTLQDGYEIPFLKEPGQYEEKNNASAINDMPLVRKMVADMISSGIVKAVSRKPRCVSPLGLVKKLLPSGEVKSRLVFDASRWLNDFVKDQKVTLTNFDKAAQLTEPMDWQATFDLTSAFYQIKIREEDTNYLGAAITNSDHSVTYFKYLHLPFGLKCAVHGITKLWKPIIGYLQTKGVRITIYIDDGRILAHTKEEMAMFLALAHDVIQKAGWQIEWTKSDTISSVNQEKCYLGFRINSRTMMISAEQLKLQKVMTILKGCTTGGSQVLQVRTLAKLIGNIAALQPSHGYLARICTRSGYLLISSHVEAHGWTGNVTLTKECVQELKFFEERCLDCNGTLITNAATSIRVDVFIDNPRASRQYLHDMGGAPFTQVVSDASHFKAAVYYLKDKERIFVDFPFNAEEKRLSSGHRELLAVTKMVEHWRATNQMLRKKIYWFTDSTNVVAFLEKGSSKPGIQQLVFKLAVNLHAMKTTVRAVHLFREDERIQAADEASKQPDSDDWSIDQVSLQKIIINHDLYHGCVCFGYKQEITAFLFEVLPSRFIGSGRLCATMGHRTLDVPTSELVGRSSG